METFIFYIELIASILFVVAMCIRFGTKHFKFSFIYQKQIFICSLFLSIVFSVTGYLLASNLYTSPALASFAVMVFGGMMGFFTLITIISERKKNKKSIYISVKANEYDIKSSTVGFFYNSPGDGVESILVIKKGEVETPVLVLTNPPKKNCDLLLECTKKDETSDVLVCKNYLCLNIPFSEWCFFLFQLYVFALFIYGLVFSSHLSLLTNGEPITGTLCMNCLMAAFVYILFNSVYQLTKNGAESYTKFMHIVFGAFRIITMIECLLVWFL